MSFVVIIDNNNKYRYVPLRYWLAFDRVMSANSNTNDISSNNISINKVLY